MSGKTARTGESPAAPRWLPAAIAAAGFAAYANSLSVPFHLDDVTWIQRNDEIRSLTDPARLLGATSRPILKLTLAMNYAVGGLDPRGFHAVNVVIHVLAALTLYGIVRRTLRSAGFRDRLGDAGPWLAAAIALLCMLHPLQTQAVTYVVQRG